MSTERTQRTVLDVMTGVFASFFAGATWRAWVCCAAALFGLAYGLDADDQAFVLQCMGRRVLPTELARRAFLVVGRRGGKSRFAAFLAVYLACFRDYSKVLAAGERGVVMLIAPDKKQAHVLLRYIHALLTFTPMLSGMVERRTAEAIHLSNNISIEVHAASFRSVRGFTIVAAIVDEGAYLPVDDSAEPDTELLAALEPAMATVPGALLLMISSPYARRGELWKAYREHFGQDGDPVFVWQADTRTMNPCVSEDVIARAYLDDPARAGAEYGAQFRSDVETFVGFEAIDNVIEPGRLELPPVAGVTYRAGFDAAGGSGADSMTLAIAHDDERGIGILDAVREVRPPFSPEAAVRDFADLLQRYGVTRVVGDRFAGEWPREQFRKHGIAYDVCPFAKSDLYKALLPRLNSGQVELLDNPKLRAQLAGLERRTARGGRDTIDHRPGGHDDLINAAAIVLAEPRKPTVFSVWTAGDSLPQDVDERQKLEDEHRREQIEESSRAIAEHCRTHGGVWFPGD